MVPFISDTTFMCNPLGRYVSYRLRTGTTIKTTSLYHLVFAYLPLRSIFSSNLKLCSADHLLHLSPPFLLFSSEGARQQLESLRTRRRHNAAACIQATWRGWSSRRRWPALRRSLTLQHGSNMAPAAAIGTFFQPKTVKFI